ncbi:transposase family protein [Desulforhopalus singaporensis]|uniref:DDE_Tnp_1-associated n=1 Tax=Desulforhopalus singaporensis TaxID=91360 RepID=A0A1H0VQN6_9BACT|nr:transposase family protein [Desulforhopalus singaporensis]SDP80664.1 DDE_Tnp_1-associated [Desulforhopalus singaporensis]
MKLTADQMRSLPEFFKKIRDPRRPQGRPHYVHVVLALAAGAILCGMPSYKSIADWTKALSPTARARFGCYFSHRENSVPSESTIRNVMIRVDPVELDQALQCWNAQYGVIDQSLAIDGKIMRNAIDENGRQTHTMGFVGYQSKHSYTPKKLVPCQ